MSIVAISQTLGSMGDDVGRVLARTVAYEFADREIILEAAGRFGEGVMALEHVTEEKPTLWERVADTQHHYLTFVESMLLEMAARDNVVLSGRGAPFVLQGIRHVLRVRVTAPERARARRLEAQQGLTAEGAEHLVRQSDRERAARLRFFYHVDWDDPLLYDLVVNTDRLTVEEAARLLQEALRSDRVQATAESRADVRDLSLAARARAALLMNADTRRLHLGLSCKQGWVTVTGMVEREDQRALVHQTISQIPGVTGVHGEPVVAPPLRPGL